MLSEYGGRMKRMKLIAVLALLAMGVVVSLSCGEGSPPPKNPSNTTTVTVTGYSQ